jgi:hypothetical protein
MVDWPSVEELVTLWLVDASRSVWKELTEIEDEQEELGRCDCGHCRKVEWAAGLELHEMWCATATELKTMLRLEATNRSTRALKLRNG